MSIKILFVIDGLEFGGGERCFAQVISGLPEDQYEIYLASSENRRLYDAIDTGRVHLVPLDFSSKYNPALLTAISKVIKEKEIDIVHGQGARAEFYSRIASRHANASKYVSTIAMPVEGYDVGSLKRRWYGLFDRLSERRVDRFIVVSEILKNLLIHQRGIPAEKVVRIYNGIETAIYDPEKLKNQREQIRSEFPLAEDIILIGAIGRLVWQKGFEYFLRCIPDVIRKFPGVRFLLVGDGELRAPLEQLSRELKIEKSLLFTGHRSDIQNILAALDIVVIPSLLEGFPMITLEAMAMKKPIVATMIDGITEQISDGIEGILVPPKDPSALASAITKLIEAPALATSLGNAARERVVKDFTVQQMIFETEQVYRSLCRN